MATNGEPAGPPEPTLEAIDPNGDLTFLVGPATTQTNFRVCSRAMIRASPVWEAMLRGNFTEAKGGRDGKPWQVELPEDNATSLRILLYIVHGNFDFVPTNNMTRDLLYEICILTDKYSMTASIKPYTKMWFDRTYDAALKTDLELVQQLWITYEMGHIAGFKKMFTNMVMHSNVSAGDDPHLVGMSNGLEYLEFDTMVRTGVLDSIKHLREVCLHSAMKSLHKMCDCLRGVNKYYPERNTVCQRQRSDSYLCDSARLGLIIRKLSEFSFWPLPAALKIRSSPSRVQAVIDLAVAEANKCLKLNGHHECKIPEVGDLSLLEEICIKNFPQAVKEHLIEQARKSGLSEYQPDVLFSQLVQLKAE